MTDYNKKLKDYMTQNSIAGEHLVFDISCHSVDEAATAAKASPQDFVKNICMIDTDRNLIVAIVKGEDHVSAKRVGKALGIDPPRIASSGEILEKTGYPCGGVPSFGYQAQFIIDPRVMEKEIVYTGGGSQNSLVKVPAMELLRANSGKLARIRR
ncbi:MAG: aminoacyl-tRNA deacylase [Bacillota bacterium]